MILYVRLILCERKIDYVLVPSVGGGWPGATLYQIIIVSFFGNYLHDIELQKINILIIIISQKSITN